MQSQFCPNVSMVHYWLSVDAVREPMRVREEPGGLQRGQDT